MLIPNLLTTFDDDFHLFFNKPETALNSESKAPDNKGDELLKIIDETVESSGIPLPEVPEISTPTIILDEEHNPTSGVEGEKENPIIINGSRSESDSEPVQGESSPSDNSNSLPPEVVEGESPKIRDSTPEFVEGGES